MAGPPASTAAGRIERGEILEAGFQALERIAVGVALLSGSNELLYLNAVARRIVGAADGIGVDRGRLVMSGAGEVFRAVFVCGRGGSFRVPRPSAAPDYIVTVLPADSAASRSRSHAGAVFITDPAATCVCPELLCQVWGLTAAEARVAMALLAGRAPGEIAARHGVSEATVRTQMRAVFDKTGTRRQRELIKMLANAGAAATAALSSP